MARIFNAKYGKICPKDVRHGLCEHALEHYKIELEGDLSVNTKGKRIDWIDICKFFAIALVVWLHFGVSQRIDRLVHLFHMPIFYLLSGLCFKYEKYSDFKPFILSRLKSLLIPYAAFSIIFYLIWTFIYFIISPQEIVPLSLYLKSLLWTNTTAVPNLWGSVQWFLTSLFFTEILYWICCKIQDRCSGLPQNQYMRYILSIVIAGAGYIAVKLTGIRLPLALDTAFPMLIFFSFGNWLRTSNIPEKIENLTLVKKLLLTLLAAVLCCGIYLIIGDTNVRLLTFHNPFIYYLGALSGCFAMLIFSMAVSNMGLENLSLYRGTLYIGRNTIIILYIHRLYIGLIQVLILSHFTIPYQTVISTVLTVLFFLCIAYPVCKFINKYLPYLIGKTKRTV